MNDLVFIRENIYSLKQEYGDSIRLGRLLSSVSDVKTGRKINQISEINIPRAIRLPNQISLEFIRSIGGQKGLEAITGSFQILIDKSDIPSTFPLSNINSYAIVQGQKHDILKIDDLQYTVIVHVKSIAGQQSPSNDFTNSVSVGSGVTNA